jgi:hypothetical protein
LQDERGYKRNIKTKGEFFLFFVFTLIWSIRRTLKHVVMEDEKKKIETRKAKFFLAQKQQSAIAINQMHSVLQSLYK